MQVSQGTIHTGNTHKFSVYDDRINLFDHHLPLVHVMFCDQVFFLRTGQKLVFNPLIIKTGFHIDEGIKCYCAWTLYLPKPVGKKPAVSVQPPMICSNLMQIFLIVLVRVGFITKVRSCKLWVFLKDLFGIVTRFFSLSKQAGFLGNGRSLCNRYGFHITCLYFEGSHDKMSPYIIFTVLRKVVRHTHGRILLHAGLFASYPLIRRRRLTWWRGAKLRFLLGCEGLPCPLKLRKSLRSSKQGEIAGPMLLKQPAFESALTGLLALATGR